MQHIQSVTEPTGKAHELLAGVEKAMGGVPNIFKVFANSPAALEGFLNFSGALGTGRLDTQLREKIALATAGLNGCDYCASAHTVIGSGAGLTENEITSAIKGQSPDTKTQAALTFAAQLVEKRGQVSSEDITSVKAAGFSDEETVEILANVALNIFTNYLNEAFQTEIDFPVVNTKDAQQAA